MDAEIGPDTTVEEVLARLPLAAKVFLARRMHCVGCDVARFETVAEAAGIYGQSADELVADLRRVPNAAEGEG